MTAASSPPGRLAGLREVRIVREYAAVLLVGTVSAGLAVMATTGDRSWATARISPAGMPPHEVVVAAATVAPWTKAAALVALAGLGAVLATAGRWRQVVGMLVAAAGLVVLGGAALAGPAVDDALRHDVAGTASGTNSAAVERALGDVSGSGWRWIAVAGGLGLTGAGVATSLRGPRWPTMGRRYEAPAVARRQRDDTDLWRAQDHGDDPTV